MAYNFFCVFYNLYEKIKNKIISKKELTILDESESNEDRPPSYDEINQTQIDLPELDQNMLNLSQIELNSGNDTDSNVSYSTAQENNSALFQVARFIIENHHRNKQ